MTVVPLPPTIRQASFDDVPALEALIARSAAGLSVGFYSAQQTAALMEQVFGVDTALVTDGSYFVVQAAGAALACGGWSRRSTGYGGDRMRRAPERLLDPATEAARIRAFFVAPEMARRGLGRMLLAHCAAAARAAGFTHLELTATLPGVPLYLALGFGAVENLTLSLSGGTVQVPLVLMRRAA